MPAPPHDEVVAYALGLLDPDDAGAFEEHLVLCPPCQAELRELAEMPALLDEVRRAGRPAPEGRTAEPSA